MEQSPLTHQPRPEVFQPKIVQLYDELLVGSLLPPPFLQYHPSARPLTVF